MRKIVFIGNCQGRRLQELYRDDFAYLNGDTTEFLFIFEPPSDRVHQLLRGADVIVAQALDSEHALDIGKFETTAKTIWYPNVTGIFLWPFSGAEHIYNRSLPYYAGGPYEFGDRWLNRKIETGIPPADIVSEYLDLDLAKAINLDRMYELHIDRARQRDARTGFDITSVIERRLTEEKLFMVPANLELPLFLPLARGVYERLGMPTGEIDRVLASLWRTPFPAGDLPIHPSIARHFGLKFVTAETRYRFCTGEQLTFIEWLERYVRFEWNDALLKATSRAGAIGRYDAEAEATLNLLRKGLEASTGSVTGYASLTHLLLLKGEKQAALEAFLRFEAFDPTNPSPPLNIAHLLAERGELEEAERRIHEVTLKWPLHADAWLRLAVIRERRENGSGAVDAIRRAVALDPRNVHLLTHFVHVIHCYDPAEDPFQAFNNAIGLDPNNTAILVAQARAETDHRRFPEAVAHIDRAIRLEPDNVELLSQKADILIRSGDLAEAEATVAKALELKPYDGRLFETRADLLIDLGRHEDAVAAIRHAVNLDPDKVPRLREIGDRLAGAGRFAEAARFYREAIERDWNNAELFSCLGMCCHGRAMR
jgi:tetratricopeptide (TPR) repeat protein